jgi:hypothetical protein
MAVKNILIQFNQHLDSSNFKSINVVEPFDLTLNLSLRQKGQCQNLPKLKIECLMTDLNMTLSPYTYCQLANIYLLFSGSG